MADGIGDRMKRYEASWRYALMPKTPIIVRVDGKAFHSFTRNAKKPSDPLIQEAMQRTMLQVCAHIDGTRFAFQQSDEISLILCDWQNFGTQPYLGGVLQKIVSVAASEATVVFNRILQSLEDDNNRRWALFDARAFNVPHHEIVNYLCWRQQDATRNSIQSLAQAHFSHKACLDKSGDELQEMLFQEKEINWNDEPTAFKRGVAAYRVEQPIVLPNWVDPPNWDDGPSTRMVWQWDPETPIFTQDRNFVLQHFPEP